MRHSESVLAANEALSLPCRPDLLPGVTRPLGRSRLHLRASISTKRPEPHSNVAIIDCRPAKPGPLRKQVMKKWQCVVCGLIYDEKDGWPDDGIAPGTLWQDVPEDWLCPDCGVGKMDFEMIEIG